MHQLSISLTLLQSILTRDILTYRTERHLKCDYDTAVCGRCERSGDTCLRGGVRFKFRHGSSARHDSTFSKDQTWLKTGRKTGHLEYIDETEGLIAFFAQGGADSDASDTDDHCGADATVRVNELHIRTSSFKSDDVKIGNDDEAGDQRIRGAARSSRLMWPPSFSQPMPGLLEASVPPLKRRRTKDPEPSPKVSGFSHNQHSNSLPSMSPTPSPRDLHSPSRQIYSCFHSADNSFGARGAFDYTSSFYSPDFSPPNFVVLPTSPISSLKLDSTITNLPSTPTYKSPFSPTLHPPSADGSTLPTSPSWIWSTPTLCEAILMRYFIDDLARWFDFCDPERHFALIVPQKARHCPPLLNAIFTASARHLVRLRRYKKNGIVSWEGYLLPNLKPETALYYHNESITHLGQLGMEADQIHNENLLAAAIILRFYEEGDAPLRTSGHSEDSEYSEVDNELFLKVTNLFINAQVPTIPDLPHTSARSSFSTICNNNLDGKTDAVKVGQYNSRRVSLDSQSNPDVSHQTSSTTQISTSDDGPVPRIPHEEGLRQACFWVAFRQEIYTSFLTQRAPNFPFDRCQAFRSFSPAEDVVWADRLIVFCADVLTFCHGTESNSEMKRWEGLKATETKWSQCLPASFEPIYFREPDRVGRGEVFPEIWYLADCHVAGVQHFELARILLAVYDPTIPRLGAGHVAAIEKLSIHLREIVLRLCGIALSNKRAPPGLLMACMGVTMCGERFTERVEQIALLGILEEMEREHAWPTEATVKALKDAWGWI